MPAAVKLREDYSAAELRQRAKRSKDANQSRRLLSLAAVCEGKDRAEAAKMGGMDRQTLRDWVHRFNAEGPRRPEAAAHAGAIGRVLADRRDRAGPEDGRRRTLASCRPEGGDRPTLRRRVSRAERRQASQGARLLAYQRAPSPPRPRRADRRGFQKRMARPVCKWFCRVRLFQSASTYPASG